MIELMKLLKQVIFSTTAILVSSLYALMQNLITKKLGKLIDLQ